MKIFADTTLFLDFYQSNKNPLKIFAELETIKASLVATSQSAKEFHRNRVGTLSWLRGAFEKTAAIKSPYTTSLLRENTAHKELCDMIEPFKKKVSEVAKFIGELIADETKDPVATKFDGLFANPAVLVYNVTEDLVRLGHNRKLLGNPPTSSDKFSAGDEVIWETLLANCKDDLIIVTHDRTYLENSYLLKKEFSERTKKNLLLITDSFSEAIKRIGEQPSPQLIEEEEEIEKQRLRNLVVIDPYALLTGAAGPLSQFYMSCRSCLWGGISFETNCPNCGKSFFVE